MITLNTILYEGNFRTFLSSDNWFFKFNYKLITKKTLTVNNLTSKEEFLTLLNSLPKDDNLEIIYVDEDKDLIKEIFNLTINEFTLGYNYTFSYFAMLNAIKTPYILNVATDCMDDINVSEEFLQKSIIELENNPICSTTMVSWVKDNRIMPNGLTVGGYEQSEMSRIKGIVFPKNGNFDCTLNFSDQFFLGKVDKLKNIDYNISENYSNQIYNGPSYGGNSFEKRIVAHQVYNNVFNFVFKNKDYYIHDKRYY